MREQLTCCAITMYLFMDIILFKCGICPFSWNTFRLRSSLFFFLFAGGRFWRKNDSTEPVRRFRKFGSNRIFGRGQEDRINNFLLLHNISQREKEVIQLIVEGKTNKEIDQELFISSHTVKNHIYNIYQKLHVKNRFQLISILQEI